MGTHDHFKPPVIFAGDCNLFHCELSFPSAGLPSSTTL
jgi:hypothetical protein